jgi:hypothetical protein
MDFIQAALTNLTQLTAIAGLGGIAVHALWKQHKRFMQQYCPPVGVVPSTEEVEAVEVSAIDTPETRVDKKVDTSLESPDISPAVIDPWQTEITMASPRYWVARQPEATKPVLMLCSAKQEKQPTKKTRKAPAKPKASKAPAKPRTTRKRKAA